MRQYFILALLFLGTFNNYSIITAQCYDNQLCYFKFDEGQGSMTYEISNKNSISLISPKWIERDKGHALMLSGLNNQYYRVEDRSFFDIARNQDFTIELMCKVSDHMKKHQVMIGRDGANSVHWWVGVQEPQGTLAFYLYDLERKGKAHVSDKRINDSVWHHVLVTRSYSLGRVDMYVDGDSVYSGKDYDYFRGFQTIGQIFIGSMAGYLPKNAYPYKGALDEIAFYDLFMYPEDVLEHYNNIIKFDNYCMNEGIAPTVYSKPPLAYQLNREYSYLVKASGIPNPNYFLRKSPDGMTIDSVTGELKWAANEEFTGIIEIEAKNESGSAIQEYKLKVYSPCIESSVTYLNFDGDDLGSDKNEIFYGGLEYNNPVWVEGQVGKALSFNGTNQYLDLASHEDFSFSDNGSFTIELLCKYNTTSDEARVMIGRNGGLNHQWWIGSKGLAGEIQTIFGNPEEGLDSLISKSNLNDNYWHHIAVVHSKEKLTTGLYIDGVLEASMAANYLSVLDYNENITIGCYKNIAATPDNFYKGELDQIAIYQRALSEDELQDHFQKAIDKLEYCAVMEDVSPLFYSVAPISLRLNDDYRYTAKAKGSPAPKYFLRKNPDGMIIDSITGELLWNATEIYEGEIEIEAKNDAGSAFQKFQLTYYTPCINDQVTYLHFDGAGIGKGENEIFFGGQEFNSPALVQGRIGKSISFNGSNQYISLTSHKDFSFNNESFTIELLCKYVASNQEALVMIGRSGGGDNQWWIGSKGWGGKIYAQFGSVEGGYNTLISKDAYNNNFWHHIVVVYNKEQNKTRLYINGVEDAVVTANYGSILNFDEDITLGCFKEDAPANFYNGELDQIAIYQRALTVDEIQKHFYKAIDKAEYCGYPIEEPMISEKNNN